MCALSVIATQPFTPCAVRRELLDQRHERQVEQDVPVVGVVDDVGDLLGEQARVDGVAHRPACRRWRSRSRSDGSRSRPACRRGRSLAPRGRQRVGELARAAMRVAVGVAVDAAFDHARHDLGVAVVALRVPDQRRDQQRACSSSGRAWCFPPSGSLSTLAADSSSNPDEPLLARSARVLSWLESGQPSLPFAARSRRHPVIVTTRRARRWCGKPACCGGD